MIHKRIIYGYPDECHHFFIYNDAGVKMLIYASIMIRIFDLLPLVSYNKLSYDH